MGKEIFISYLKMSSRVKRLHTHKEKLVQLEFQLSQHFMMDFKIFKHMDFNQFQG